ncbi:hypothetical protein MTR67_026076 [Solanum verrucosum]|uniref:Uncharacterized protein n=1 Tax=Solanum verrucosum TaxID=315347 RepID=A0AAF0TU44_SOLVR|nr:hypothetical protein MTR67_026076 [Solanum verrucosum]
MATIIVLVYTPLNLFLLGGVDLPKSGVRWVKFP